VTRPRPRFGPMKPNITSAGVLAPIPSSWHMPALWRGYTAPMKPLLSLLGHGLSGVLGPGMRPQAARNYRCRCGQPVFFHNSVCLACGSELGFDPEALTLRSLVPGMQPGIWRAADDLGEAGPPLQRCANFGPAGCNWLLPPDQAHAHDGLCRACRLNHTIPDLDDGDNALLWSRVERAKRRLVAQLLALGLPVQSKVSEDPERGVMFDFLHSAPGAPRVVTGHAGGLITLDLDEADDATRETMRNALREPYRTLLGHLRHEIGHYYWDRLVAGSGWLGPFRARFGDERQVYAAALERHYQTGPAADWPQRCVSAYASAHPWEDWAETWANYLHMVDTLDTALSFGLEGGDVEIRIEPYGADALDAAGDPGAPRFLGLVNAWLQITALMNELARSMGQPDLCPFVLSHHAVAKLHFVHRVVSATAAAHQ